MTEAWIWPAGLGLLGLLLGSFIATLVIRWPEGRSVSKGRSECDSCHKVLTPGELIPVVSYVLQRGRCRGCGGRIAPLHLIVELFACAVGVTAGYLAPGVEGVFGAALGWILLALAAIDYAAFWLPNVLTLTLTLGGLAEGLLTNVPPQLSDRLIGGVAGYAVLWLVAAGYRRMRGREGLGGGDPKMFGAIGCCLGWQALPMVLLLASLTGLAIVVALRPFGHRMGASDRLPLGALLAPAAFTMWIVTAIP